MFVVTALMRISACGSGAPACWDVQVATIAVSAIAVSAWPPVSVATGERARTSWSTPACTGVAPGDDRDPLIIGALPAVRGQRRAAAVPTSTSFVPASTPGCRGRSGPGRRSDSPRTVAMAEIAEDMREGLLALAVGTGLQVVSALMAAGVSTVCGPRGKHVITFVCVSFVCVARLT